MEPAELIANKARRSTPHGAATTGNLPKLTALVLNEAAVRSDQKNDHAPGGASDRRAHRSPRASCRTDERANTGPNDGPSEDFALKLRCCGGAG